ncbi:MAG: RNA polymerase sigma factor [Acidobacteria bacterium]|nr:RNA polymerase sigma factor [Acidobacteriota bacterium]
MEPETERDLVARLRGGEASAFEAIYEHYRSRLYAYLLRMSRQPDVAEDLLEETWLRLIAHPPKPDAEMRLAPWLFTVARNLFLSWSRWRLLDAERIGELARITLRAPLAPGPVEELARDERERALERALACLPARAREVLLLVGVEGMTPVEAAAVCGITPEAMRARLARARRQLVEAMRAAPAKEGRS